MENKEILENLDEWKKNYDLILTPTNGSFNEKQIQYFEQINTKYDGKHDEYERILRLLINIYNNFRGNSFQKTTQILIQLKDSIKRNFSNFEIFNIFKSNKKLTLFLIEANIIKLDENIYHEVLNTYESNETRYFYFFFPEIKSFIGEKISKFIEDDLLEQDSNIFENFNEKRKEGQNDSYVCSLIRQDLIDEFIIYVNETNLLLSNEIKRSIFETNPFLIENHPDLIEYTAFFGSIKIFHYLRLNNIQLKSSLWLYSIHSNNAELIRILEDIHIDPPNNSYKECFIEAIKCHHNEIAIYIKENYLNKQSDDENVISAIFRFQNYFFFPSFCNKNDEFFNLCFYNYSNIVDLFMKMKEGEIKEKIILKNLTFNDVQNFDKSLQEAANENEYEIVYYLLLNHDEIKNECFKENKNIKKIVLPPSIKRIGTNSFYRCASLTSISIPSSITTIENGAFSGCLSLKDILIPSSVISIGDHAFDGCLKIEKMMIPSSVTSIGNYAFSWCSSLVEISIPFSITAIGEYFLSYCTSLAQISIPPSIESIETNAFRGCSSLKQIIIPSSVKSIQNYAFYGCSSLKELFIPSSLRNIGSHIFPSQMKIIYT